MEEGGCERAEEVGGWTEEVVGIWDVTVEGLHFLVNNRKLLECSTRFGNLECEKDQMVLHWCKLHPVKR